MIQNSPDSHGIFHAGNNLEWALALALVADFNVDIEYAFQALGPGHRHMTLREAANIAILSSLPAILAPAHSPFSDWSGDGFDYTPTHEFWHILHFAHLSNKDDFGNRQGGNAEQSRRGPDWFIEGSAVYMANIALTKQIISGYESVQGHTREKSFECEMQEQLNRSLEARSQNPGLKLGDFSYEVGRNAIYGLGA